MPFILKPIQMLGHYVLCMLASLGQWGRFTGHTIMAILWPPFYAKQTMRQLFYVGYLSLPVVGLTAIFSGMVLALQSYTGFARFNAENAIANVVVLSITRELGPVLAGLMVAGRVGAAMAAEIGTMRVSEQIDALTLLSTDPMRYLVAPRVIASVLSMPLLVLIADIIGVMGGYAVSVYQLGFNASHYMHQTLSFLEMHDVISGVIKAAVFGFVIALMGCYQGYISKGGAAGVGRATTYAVVSASVLILLSNYALTSLLFTK